VEFGTEKNNLLLEEFGTDKKNLLLEEFGTDKQFTHGGFWHWQKRPTFGRA
jgi:hypothetical protein